ncbi:HD domain-containing protein [Sulfobacillus thermosulfidooxidans]|uniref:HD domain-containing protein n=1 Tax=Sulfobacillus thermosulfidooxidans TaxID=28034 RepID=UPI000417353A|nr:HD domain-containing protein [Sulfobacillus thermosulfidooxidans]
MQKYLVERPHAVHVARLSLKLYDSLMGLLDFPSNGLWRECLETAALLHDVGYFINKRAHHRHSRYIIRHAMETQSWEDPTRSCVATLAYFHRKALTLQKFHQMSHNPAWFAMTSLLRIADGIDRCHHQQADIRQIEITTTTVELFVCGLKKEPWDHLLQIKAQGFHTAFHRQLLLHDVS